MAFQRCSQPQRDQIFGFAPQIFGFAPLSEPIYETKLPKSFALLSHTHCHSCAFAAPLLVFRGRIADAYQQIELAVLLVLPSRDL